MIFTPIGGVFHPKAPLREKMKRERAAAFERSPNAGAQAAAKLLRDVPLPDKAVVALYHPVNSELDTEPLFDALTERGLAVCLPVTPPRKGPLTFRRFAAGEPLIEGRYGIMVPDDKAAEVDPDVIVVPLLGFTRAGGRLGYGGGYYDRTLEALRAKKDVLAVGYGFAAQEVDALPHGPRDEPLDWIVTEREAFATRAQSLPES